MNAFQNLNAQEALTKTEEKLRKLFITRTVFLLVAVILLSLIVIPFIFGDAFEDAMEDFVEPLETMEDTLDDMTNEEKLLLSPVVASTVIVTGASMFAAGIALVAAIMILVLALIVEVVKHIVFYFAYKTKKQWLVIIYAISIFVFPTLLFFVDVFMLVPFMRTIEFIRNKTEEDILPKGYKLNQ